MQIESFPNDSVMRVVPQDKLKCLGSSLDASGNNQTSFEFRLYQAHRAWQA